MSPLEHLQASMAATLAHGPAHLEAWLYDCPADRLLLALKAHANTISHARLVALEDTFPMTREARGHAGFHMLSRAYLDLPGTTARPLADIGAGLPGFLADRGTDPGLVDLARAEWAWLQAWRAADARPLALGDLAGLAEAQLLATPIAVHPAARLLSLSAPAGAAFAALGDVRGARILLFTRPEADVQVTALEPAARALFVRARAMSAGHPVTIGELMARLVGEAEHEDPAPAFLALAGAGAFARPGVAP